MFRKWTKEYPKRKQGKSVIGKREETNKMTQRETENVSYIKKKSETDKLLQTQNNWSGNKAQVKLMRTSKSGKKK